MARGIQLLSDSARKVADWTAVNGLTLNAKNTKAIVFGSPHTFKLFKNLGVNELSINNSGDKTQFVVEILSLGV